MVAAATDVLTWVEGGAALPDEDVASNDGLTWRKRAKPLVSSLVERGRRRGEGEGDAAVARASSWSASRRLMQSFCNGERNGSSPPYFLTPKRFPIELRPFFDEPPPRFVA